MEKRTLYIIAIIAAIVVVFAITNLSGQSILGTYKGACLDTDGGKNYDIKGTVSYANREYSYTDECYVRGGKTEGRWLKEYFCLGDDITNLRYDCSCATANPNEPCETTECVDGACV